MDIGVLMNVMRDPAGLPAHPILFQVLMVLSWVFHIAFVNLTIGAAGLAIYAFFQRDKCVDWQLLSMAMTKVAKVGVSLLIVLGVAPLLFMQVIYDPQWYVSNLLSGAWTILFVFLLIVAYCAWFVFYYANQPVAKRRIVWFACLALVLLCVDGLIMHGLSYQAILPHQWLDWYAPNGVVHTSGLKLHAIEWPRYVFIMSLCMPAVGLFLIAYAHYFAIRADFEFSYLTFVHTFGKRLAYMGFAFSSVLFLVWQFVQSSDLGLQTHPLGWVLWLGLVVMTLWLNRAVGLIHPYVPMLCGFFILLLLAIWREVIRMAHLRPFGYDISTYPVHVDWPSAVLFVSTFLGVGGLVGGFYLSLLYRCGRVQGVYVADRSVSRMGTAAIVILVIWIAVFFVYGITIWLNNRFN